MQGRTMGTHYNIKYAPAHVPAATIQNRVDHILKKFDDTMSNWSPNSWVSQFNKSANGIVNIPENAYESLSLSVELFKHSDGKFDMTVSPLIELWGFGYNQKKKIPSDKDIKTCLEKIGTDKLQINFQEMKISKKYSETRINCSATAKGHGVDLIAKVLEEEFKIEYYLVEIGGEVRATSKPNGKAWNIGIPIPKSKNNQELQLIANLKNKSMATSGGYHNFFEMNGKSYQHILNAKTGYPIQHSLCSVSIIAPSCRLADGLATTCLILGKTEGINLLKKYPNCSALFIKRLENGSFENTFLQGFKQLTQ